MALSPKNDNDNGKGNGKLISHGASGADPRNFTPSDGF